MDVRIKICGLTNWDDAWLAVEAGAHALGFVFHPASPRCLSVAAAAAITRRLPPFVARVGVFVDTPADLIRAASRECRLDAVQLHGEESPEFCAAMPVPVLKAFRLRDAGTLAVLPRYQTAAWLLDSFVPGQPGGTGAVFNWALAVEAAKLGCPIILAGGLTPANVADAIRQVRPYAVDVSSGVEAVPGRKDPAKVRAFIQAARLAATTAP